MWCECAIMPQKLVTTLKFLPRYQQTPSAFWTLWRVKEINDGNNAKSRFNKTTGHIVFIATNELFLSSNRILLIPHTPADRTTSGQDGETVTAQKRKKTKIIKGPEEMKINSQKQDKRNQKISRCKG